MEPGVPTELTQEWLNAALEAAEDWWLGPLKDVRFERIGQGYGMAGEIWIARCADDTAVVVKFGSAEMVRRWRAVEDCLEDSL